MEIFLLHENTTLSVAVYKRQYLTDCVSRLMSRDWRFVAYAQGIIELQDARLGRSCFLQKCIRFTISFVCGRQEMRCRQKFCIIDNFHFFTIAKRIR